MARYLVIVESPTKVKTIKKFLGSNYVVVASNGHVRDLPKSQLGVGPENDYEPKYITIRGKGEILANLRKEVKKADKVYLATDPDREGEAISWHLCKALKLENKKTYRISFNEITKNAVKASLKNAREIDMDLVDAQQARRVLDRVVGYKISPVLWAKVKRGLSAGRVQSVALRIIADREEEINAFIPEEYWSLDANLKVKGERKLLNAKFYGTDKKKMTISSKEELDKILKELELSLIHIYSEIQGQEIVKRAATVAVAGGPNLLLVGPPGSGKTMAAKRIPTILPKPSLEESMEVTSLYSVVGKVEETHPLMLGRPFREVHHTVTKAAAGLSLSGSLPLT